MVLITANLYTKFEYPASAVPEKMGLRILKEGRPNYVTLITPHLGVIYRMFNVRNESDVPKIIHFEDREGMRRAVKPHITLCLFFLSSFKHACNFAIDEGPVCDSVDHF